ncbi:CoA transferase [Ideonella sp. BN130291]|uniref:CoA transferase n=1 Tax=Ideonella sp. BN130291 TaxID=3112940 RepID=UPI002E2548AC|nr:CoA transferase [Ideonella sp. BN130291]
MPALQTPHQALSSLWATLGGAPAALDAVTLTGTEPVLPSSFAVGTAAQASIAAAALAACEVGVLRGGPPQQVRVDMHHAAAEFRSERYLRIHGEPPADPWDRIAGFYRTGSGGGVRVHTNFPHHRDGILRLLGCEYDKAAVARALLERDAVEFETLASDAGLCVAALRSMAEWDALPQARAVAGLPVLSVTRIDASPVRPLQPLPAGARPLHGLRVLDLTRVVAGPVAGRTLAAHGADVMLVTAAHLPAIDTLVVDTGRGKRSAQLDLRTPAGREALQALVRQADVFLQGYRPGGLAALGFGPDALARLRPGIVCASLTAYGPIGPWARRRGFDSLVQTASGFNVAEAEAAGSTEPRPLPAQALDHASGYLLAFGIARALARRATEGGSWHVQVSLAQTAHWLRGLGRVPGGLAAPDPSLDDVRGLLEESDSGFGRLLAVRHAGQLERTPPTWTRPAVPLGSHRPVWTDQ